MSAKTVRVKKPDDTPSTPVIIKSGGGLDDTKLPEPLTPVEIDSPITFVELVREATKWEASQSTSPGRIAGFTINNGVSMSCDIPNPSSELASLTILYGSEQLIVRESRGEDGAVFLVIESPEVHFSGPESGEWTTSSATFRHLMRSVTLMLGDQRQLQYDCHSASVEVSVNFQQI